jgi:SAM-dependent MidA family methyltransferase
MSEVDMNSRLTALLLAEIQRFGGVLPFDRFMHLVLYAEGVGYYERDGRCIGRSGDFYTSVSAGSVFGELLALQFSEWIEENDSTLNLVEAGAHDGRLAKDILSWFRRYRPAQRLDYWIIEPSVLRRSWQAKTLQEVSVRVSWLESIDELRNQFPAGLQGVVFSNELLDAFPVHRIRWNRPEGRWRELGVGLENNRFVWRALDGPLDSRLVQMVSHLPEALLALFPDGFTTDYSTAGVEWWREAALALKRGRLMAIDYGITADEFFLPQRRDGTLRGYRDHRLVEDLLDGVGETDLTAHVNFSSIIASGESAGLTTEAYLAQRQWLTQVFGLAVGQSGKFDHWTSSRVRQFQTLTHPDFLGRNFRVLIQKTRNPRD